MTIFPVVLTVNPRGCFWVCARRPDEFRTVECGNVLCIAGGAVCLCIRSAQVSGLVTVDHSWFLPRRRPLRVPREGTGAEDQMGRQCQGWRRIHDDHRKPSCRCRPHEAPNSSSPLRRQHG